MPVALALDAAAVPAAVPEAVPLDLAAVPVAVPARIEELTAALKVWPKVGRATLPLTFQRPLVEAGHAGGERLGEYAEAFTPDGERVFHWLLRLLKSGLTGVGVPDLVYPSGGALVAVAATDGP